MNADRIVVVENGQITEQGSHDELIGANGKYADLWSKQVFVKPKKKNDLSIDSNATIINDLTDECTTSELAKVKSTASHSEGSAQGDESESQRDSNPTGTANGHKKEVDSAEESSITLADSDSSL
jgi:ABC-type multidrug transport system ATPase subunit